MNKNIVRALWAVVIVIVLGALWWMVQNTGGQANVEKPLENNSTYTIEEIVPGEVYSIKPVYEDVQKETFTSGMTKVKAGMKEIGKSYRIVNGETIIKFTIVFEEIVYVQKREVSNNCSANITANTSIQPDN